MAVLIESFRPVHRRPTRSGLANPSHYRRMGKVVASVVGVGLCFAGCGSSPQSFYIPSCANYPTLRPGYHIEVQKPAHTIRRGDFVVFGRPNPLGSPSPAYSVMRVVGLPGEDIASVNGHVTIDGRLLDEPYLPHGTATNNLRGQTVPAGQYFVMGDNRSDSSDSRSYGPVSRDSIIGKSVGIRTGTPPPYSSCNQ